MCVINPDSLIKFVSVLHHCADRLFFKSYFICICVAARVFPGVRGLSLVAVHGLSGCGGFLCSRTQALGMQASVVAVCRLSCSAVCVGSPQIRNQTHVYCITRWILNHES